MNLLMVTPPILSDWLALGDLSLWPVYTLALMLLWLAGDLAAAYDRRTKP